jgi:two-component system chemotaxis sensor kinase CheA
MFFEEARELLIGLEEGLMDLERKQTDRAHLDKTFRAAHTLKGAAAMVGLGSISEFTHNIEAVLERIRSGLLPIDSDIITTLLEARDHLAAMVEAEAARSPIPHSSELAQRLTSLLRGPSPASAGPKATIDRGPAPAPASPPQIPPAAQPVRPDPKLPIEFRSDPAANTAPEPGGVIDAQPAAVTDDASLLLRGGEPTPQQPPAKRRKPQSARQSPASKQKPQKRSARKMQSGPVPPPAKPVGSGAGASDDPNLKSYQITLVPGPEILRRGINPLGVLDELRELGETTVATDPSLVPGLESLDPERCYLNWQITVRTRAEAERLDEAFLFFAEDSTVTIEERLADGKLVPRQVGAQPPSKASTPAVPPAAGRPAVPASSVPLAPAPVPAAPADEPAVPAAHPAAAPTLAAPAQNQAAIPRPHARIRVDSAQLDELVGLAGELAVVSDNLMGLRLLKGAEDWDRALESLQRVSRQIRDTTLDLRMVPVDELFSRFPRVVRDLADRSGKEIELRIVGQETRLDRTIVERLSDPMIHLIRNAVDHALESPEERIGKRKPRVGRITLWAGHEGDRVAIRVEDDGRGLDRDKIVRKGIALGRVPAGTSPDDPRVVNLIFEPGFSTRDAVSELSGRGVGLDVVRDAVRGLRGSVAVESTPGKGTAFVFRLPLTLALIDGLLVETGGGKFVVPLAQVEECFPLNGTRSALAEARACVAVRGELVPMVSLRNLFRADGPLPARQELLLTRQAGQRVGVAVDRLLGRVQAVIQSLGEGLHSLSRFSGATILGDGSVSLILDLSALVAESRIAEQTARFTPPGI